MSVLIPSLHNFATVQHNNIPKGKKNFGVPRNIIKDRILCPCLNCQRWRAKFQRPGIAYAINKALREEIEQNRKISKEMDSWIKER